MEGARTGALGALLARRLAHAVAAVAQEAGRAVLVAVAAVTRPQLPPTTVRRARARGGCALIDDDIVNNINNNIMIILT